MIFRRRTRLLDAAFFVLVVALFSNVSRGADPASGDKPAPEKSAAKPARKNVKLPGPIINGFTPEKEMNPGRVPRTTMTFKGKGMTGNGPWIRSGDTLVDLNRHPALKMTAKKTGGDDYLFVEAGAVSDRKSKGWQLPSYAIKRKQANSQGGRVPPL